MNLKKTTHKDVDHAPFRLGFPKIDGFNRYLGFSYPDNFQIVRVVPYYLSFLLNYRGIVPLVSV
jgi:hypothetical protein